MKLRSYFVCALDTTLNIILYALTCETFLWLEGRVNGGYFRNWARNFRYRPGTFVKPTTEQQIIDLVKNSSGIRFFGAGHSFNDGVVADEVLVSLDDYKGMVSKDVNLKQMRVRGGTRMRDVIKLLLDQGWAFKALPSHDAQSIAGILSTDVHGTGRNWGFVSESVVSLRVIDGLGNVRECFPTDDLFRAAVGGVGAVGIISEVVVQAVERFNVEQNFRMSTRSFVFDPVNFQQLLQENEHFSLYLFPFTDKCQINTWNRTTKAKSPLGSLRELISISADALLSAWFGNFMAYTGLLPTWSDLSYAFKRGTDLVLESSEAFTRTIYHRHQELEFTVPFEETLAMCNHFLQLYEQTYTSDVPYALFEIRFTPGDHELSLIGPGQQGPRTWIDLVINDSYGYDKFYSVAEASAKNLGARPHLGKFCTLFHQADLFNLYQNNFVLFQQLRQQQDPQQKFSNVFTRRIF
jgi:hypothetical protein